MSKIWSKTGISAIAGLFSFVVTMLVLFVPFKGEPAMSLINWQSPLGIIVVVLLIITIVFYAVAIFKHELGHREWNIIVEERQEYIPLFRRVVDKMITRMKELSIKAGELPLGVCPRKSLFWL